MKLDDLDLKILKENFDEETIYMLNSVNVAKILKYLNDNNIYYAKDLWKTFPRLEFLSDTRLWKTTIPSFAPKSDRASSYQFSTNLARVFP